MTIFIIEPGLNT